MVIVMSHILVIEDEHNIARVLQLELQFEHYKVTVAHTGAEGLATFLEGQFDLVLLDIMLPEMNGFDVLKRIRKHNETIPVLLLTAKNDIMDKVNGLDLGANDYITKPFEFEELLARIRAALRLRRSEETRSENEHASLTFGHVSLNEATREVFENGRLIELTPREFDLLHHFLHHPRHVQSRDQLINQVWGYDYFGDTNVVDVYVRYIRQKLSTNIIHTVRGIGYVLKEPVE